MEQANNMQQRPPILLYTDGASSGNPGPGGYGVVLKCAGYAKEMSGGFSLTTNNRMELLAVIKGLEAINWPNAEVHVWSDSSYVVNAINKGWLENWQRKGYAKVKNPDLCEIQEVADSAPLFTNKIAKSGAIKVYDSGLYLCHRH